MLQTAALPLHFPALPATATATATATAGAPGTGRALLRGGAP